MADRESFPYDRDWVDDFPVLIEHGIVQVISQHLTETRPRSTRGVREGLHCRVVWSKWDFVNNGEPFLNIQYKFPSIIFGENDTGHFPIDEEPLNIDDPEVIAQLTELADRRSPEVLSTFSGDEYVPAKKF